MLIQKISNMSAKDIPDVLVDGLHMDIDEARVLEYHNTREVRNKIAHGESVNLTIEQVTNMSKALRSLALDIDQHLLRYYFISESYLD
jgi:tRNA G37 N-methylase TrmD